MFYLTSSNVPASSEQLAQAVASTLHQVFSIPPGRSPVVIRGGYPSLDEVRIDLNGSAVRADQRPPKPEGIGQIQPGPAVRQLAAEGQPILIEGALLNLALAAQDAQFHYDRDAQGRLLLMLHQARDGSVRAQVAERDLQALLLAGATTLAEAHGLAITDAGLTLTQIGPRSVAVDVRLAAKKFVTATIHILGQLRIDDQLNARLSDLTCHGDGMVGKLVSGLLNPYLQKLNGRELPLMALSLGQVRLRDIQIDTRDGLLITARFGG